MIIYAFHPVLQLLLRKALLLQRLSIRSFLTPPTYQECFISLSALSIAHFSLFVKRVFFIFLLQFLIPSRFYDRAFSPIHVVRFSIIDLDFIQHYSYY